ncbi:T7SS effector LXG polymorphic toxin [Metabacillus halosaccharovorans]|uniref:T7SS effector LXG polymorphic toxin n=1 Tax=Metabacillus halosaccharovorans TaxID=930124 RepID=UPI00203D7AEC|nr:T7SS effector LXG polymorphic toxin [Metabacillus halosaccharovorans]MCM3439381.1 T7SS effector LXG polymorphic toxin [Metabacillus halosaccharovorans]
MKVLETKTLIESMEDRAKVYTDFRDKIDTLKKEFTDITQLDDALQGKGADAIKGFYQAQIEVADGLLRLVDMQIAFLNGVSGAIADIDLSGDTVVDVNFLETDLSIHASNHIAMVESQREDLQKIIDGIDDIVNLEAFSADDFNTAMDDATKKRENTIKDVDALDQQLLEEYKLSENAEFHIGALFQQLLEATAQGNTISPINFDAQAYKASEAYQLSDEVQQYADDYLSFKEDQEKIREELKKAEELENRPVYEKAWDTVKTFIGEATGYYDFLRAKDGVDPVTGEELTDGQRVAAGAMATAGFIPIVGWGGRLFKGGSAIYKTAKGMNSAEQALSVYKTTSTFSNLQKAELGIYGLASANGLSEYITGKDMFGNELTDVQRQSSLFNSILGASLVASPFVPSLVKNGKLVKEETLNQLHKLATKTKSGALYVYDEVSGGMRVLFGNQNMNFAYAGADGVKPILSNMMNSKEIKNRIEDVVSRFSFGKNVSGSNASGYAGEVVIKHSGENIVKEVKEIDFGKHIIKGKNGKKQLLPNTKYVTNDYYKYTTDELGRIVNVDAPELVLKKADRNKYAQANVGGSDRLPDDDGGHLIGAQFNGPPDIDNLVPQNSQINRKGGVWYEMETEWANALKEVPPKKVSVSIEPIYTSNSMRPNSFMVEYEIEGEFPVIREIANKSGG